MNNIDPHDVVLVEYTGQLHGSIQQVVHITSLYKLYEHIEKLGLKVLSVKTRGWLPDDTVPKSTEQWHEMRYT